MISLRVAGYDPREEFSHILKDVMAITGHKFYQAKDLKELKDLDFDLLILDFKDISTLPEIVKVKENFLVFVLAEEEEVEKLKEAGLLELSFILKPFNPLELLNKLGQLLLESNLSNLGLLNTLLKLRREKVYGSLHLIGEAGDCLLIRKDLEVVGSTCPLEELRKALKLQYDLVVSTEGVNIPLAHSFNSTVEFLRDFLKPFKEEVKPKERQVVREIEEELVLFSYKLDELYSINVYLKSLGGRINLLIGCGNFLSWPELSKRIDEVFGGIDKINVVVVLSPSPRLSSGLLKIYEKNHRFYVLTSKEIGMELRAMGIPLSRIRFVENFPNMSLSLPTGDTLKFVKLPFLPQPGSLIALLKNKIFSGELFGSYTLTTSEFATREEFLLYHLNNIPNAGNSLKYLRGLDFEAVLPSIGKVLLDLPLLEELTELSIDQGKVSSVVELLRSLGDEEVTVSLEEVLKGGSPDYFKLKFLVEENLKKIYGELFKVLF